MSVVGVGVDLVKIERIRSILDSDARDRFVASVFTDDEVEAAQDDGDPAVAFATRFAIKEAVFKSFQTSFAPGDQLRDIEVRENAAGAPYVVLSRRFDTVLAERGAAAPAVSVSFEDEHVVAVAVAARAC